MTHLGLEQGHPRAQAGGCGLGFGDVLICLCYLGLGAMQRSFLRGQVVLQGLEGSVNLRKGGLGRIYLGGDHSPFRSDLVAFDPWVTAWSRTCQLRNGQRQRDDCHHSGHA